MVNARSLMILVAVICFVLSAVALPTLGGVVLVPLGLALWAGSSLVG